MGKGGNKEIERGRERRERAYMYVCMMLAISMQEFTHLSLTLHFL